MPTRKRPTAAQLFPGLDRRAAEARDQAAVLAEMAGTDLPAPSGRGRQAILRTQAEIETDLRALSDQEREAILSSSHLVTDVDELRDQIRYVDIAMVHPNPDQPRKTFDPGKMAELIESIRVNGVLSPIHVRGLAEGHYQIIAGERRWRAAHKAGRTQIPVIVKTVSAQQALELALLENLQREDLSALDEARTYQFMLDEFHYTQAQVAERIGKKQAYVSKMLALLDLAPGVLALLAPAADQEPDENIPRGIIDATDSGSPTAGRLAPGAAIVLSRIADPTVQVQLAQRVVDEGLTVRQVEALVREWKAGTASEPTAPALPDPGVQIPPLAEDDEDAGAMPRSAHRAVEPTVFPSAFGRPAPAGPQIRFADLSLFQLYREVGRITTVDLARLEDALESDRALIQSIRAAETAATEQAVGNPAAPAP